MFNLSGFRRKDKYFLIFLLIGFLFKYNYLNLKIFNIPMTEILIFRNILFIFIFGLIAKYLVKNKKAYVISFIVYSLFFVFFLTNLWYNRYFGNYLSLADITMGQGFRPFKVLIRQLFLLKDVLFIFEFPILIYLTFFKKDNTLFRSSKYKFSNTKKGKLKYKLGIVVLIIILFAGQFIYANYIFEDENIMKLYEESTPAFVGVYGVVPLYLAEFNYLYINNNDKTEKTKMKEVEIKSDTELSGKYDLNSTENIPLLITHSELEGETITKTGSHTDLGPTIIDLIGEKKKPTEFLGESLLKKGEHPVVFLNEIPQILYKDQLFLKVPSEMNGDDSFKKISHKKDQKREDIELKKADKENIKEIINYMQEIMKEK